jgi:hypothetical protein
MGIMYFNLANHMIYWAFSCTDTIIMTALHTWFYCHWQSQVLMCVHMCSMQGMKNLWAALHFTTNSMILYIKLNVILNLKLGSSFLMTLYIIHPENKSVTTQFLWVIIGPTYKLTSGKLSVQYAIFTYVSIWSFWSFNFEYSIYKKIKLLLLKNGNFELCHFSSRWAIWNRVPN